MIAMRMQIAMVLLLDHTLARASQDMLGMAKFVVMIPIWIVSRIMG